MTEKEFRELLEGVPMAYPAFVDGVVDHAHEFGTMDAIAEFIIQNPTATAGDVSDLSGRLAGLI